MDDATKVREKEERAVSTAAVPPAHRPQPHPYNGARASLPPWSILQRGWEQALADQTVRLRSWLTAGAAAMFSVLLLACVFLRLVNYDLRKDEQLYVPPARLLDDHSLYLDFFYNHTPGAAWWFHGVRQLLGSDYLLFDGRVGVFFAWLVLAAAIGALVYTLTRSAWIAWSITVLTLINELFLTQTGMSATNNFLPLPFAFIGLGLFVVGASSANPRNGLIFLSGLFLSVAVVFKVSAVAFILPTAMGAFFLPRHLNIRERLWRMVLPLVGGGLIGGLPILFFLMTDRTRFLAHIIGYHLGPHARYFRDGIVPDDNPVMTTSGKLVLAHELWLGGTIAIGLVALAIVILIRANDEGRHERPRFLSAAFVVAGAFCISAGFSLVPTPSFPQYFAPPLICLPLGLMILVAELSPSGRKQAEAVLVAASVVVIAAQAPRLLQHIGTIASPERWTVARVHASGVEMADRLIAANSAGKVATLAPIYPLEGGLSVYPELATGPFAFRTADLTEPDLAGLYRMASAAGIPDLFEANPPAALLLGFEPDLEKPLLDYAAANGYLPLANFQIQDRYGAALLYVKPGG